MVGYPDAGTIRRDGERIAERLAGPGEDPDGVLSIQQHAAVAYISRPDLYEVGLLWHDYFGATIASALLSGACAVMLREESLVLQDDFTQVVVRSYKGIWVTLWIRRE
jgi:hypothetical protein